MNNFRKNHQIELTSYLKNGRLGEVLALIQVLAFDKFTNRSERGLCTELKNSPASADSWLALAKQHPEFFRERKDSASQDRVSLIARYVVPSTRQNNKRIRPQLDAALTNKLMEIAIELHDRQRIRSERWQFAVTQLVAAALAFVAAAALIAAAYIGSSHAM